eukprot:TRINITY_DN6432_c0_g1_i1.p1 TRINITY_DN6432_c0_g1~~TRINITY_DN6432_c0_g1_i1.p1  ORF type:complete len:724 (-),score=148.83 TRINITY_DN6432_c0_g1_i1:62-2233(-)
MEDDLDELRSVAGVRAKETHLLEETERGAFVSLSIHSFSSFSKPYHPRGVLVHRPQDQLSRWSVVCSTPQWLVLELSHVAIVGSLTFGKYMKPHVCNLKEFQVFGGITPACDTLILHDGLKNDDAVETFLIHSNPVCRYVKIVPISAWGTGHNASLWYIEIHGDIDVAHTQAAALSLQQKNETLAMRMCLKHLRQRNLMESFLLLQKQTGVQLEDPLLTQLHTTLVIEGNFGTTLELLGKAKTEGMFHKFSQSCAYIPKWKRILPAAGESVPRMRGGHQMCVDPHTLDLYLFGGWDGTKDLNDLWVFRSATRRWVCLSSGENYLTSHEPSPRSCHKICFDGVNRRLYTLGRYVDPDQRESSPPTPDMFMFDVRLGKWILISKNTKSEGGPDLIYDHQMCLDAESQNLYVFGGRVSGGQGVQNEFSGLFKYSINLAVWSCLRGDVGGVMRSRIGHSMVWHSHSLSLYVFGGQRNKEYLNDLCVYDTKTDKITEISSDCSKLNGPSAGFTQRATIDCQKNEIYVLSGLLRERNTHSDQVKNCFWVYHIDSNRWTRVYENSPEKISENEPCPRFAHQLVYQQDTHTHFLFGGNPGDGSDTRLDDFWELSLHQTTPDEILRRAKFLVTKQRFLEICQTGDAVSALAFLQSEVSSVVDHQNPAESAEFRCLAPLLFDPHGKHAAHHARALDPVVVGSAGPHFAARTKLFETLCEFFPPEATQPAGQIL